MTCNNITGRNEHAFTGVVDLLSHPREVPDYEYLPFSSHPLSGHQSPIPIRRDRIEEVQKQCERCDARLACLVWQAEEEEVIVATGETLDILSCQVLLGRPIYL